MLGTEVADPPDDHGALPVHRISVESADGRLHSYDCAQGETLMLAGTRAGVRFPPECRVGNCGHCRIHVVDGAVATFTAATRGMLARQRPLPIKLGCQAYPLSDCHIVLVPQVSP
jgi:toluene monooxygenase electron transfer component